MRPMRKRTTVEIDVELLQGAAAALGRRRMIDTIHAALSEVVAYAKRRATRR